MKKSLYLLFIVTISGLLTAGNCSKGGSSGGGGGTPSEATLVIETNPAAGSSQAPAPGPDFPLTVTIKSALPSAGVRIDITAKQDGTTTNFFTATRTTTTSINNFTITNSPRSLTLRTDITVTSLSNSNNRATSSYTYSRK